MRKLFVAAALVAACSVANATEVKKDTKAPAVSAKAMTDTDMDKVTAAGQPTTLGAGLTTAGEAGGNASPLLPTPPSHVPVFPGSGTGTRP